MANEPITTVVGNLTADPELRYVGSGIPVADFTVASTPRSFDRNTNDWKDGEPLFLRCTVWRDYAENVAESLSKGMQVIAYGKLIQRRFTDKHGNDRTVVEMQVDEVGPTLRWSRAQVTRASRDGGFGGATPAPQQPQSSAQFDQAPQGGGEQDPWADQGKAPF